MERPPRDTAKDKGKSSNFFERPTKKYKTDEGDFDCIFTMPQEKIFAELKNENILRQPNQIMVPDHMKDKTKFCMFHDDYGHTLATCKNLYAQLRAMIIKGMLLKYLKKKVLLGSLNKPRETERVVIKMASE